MNIEEVVGKIIEIIEKKKINNKISKGKEEKVTPIMPKEKLSNKISRAIVKGAIYAYCKIVYRAKIIGTENIPKDGALIFCGNHRSFLDPPLIEVTCKRDDTRFLAKKELTKNKFLALLGKVFNAILVNRDSKDISALKESIKTLKSGGCIALFPEGTRNGLAKGEKAKGGVAYFALNSDAKVIPVGIRGGLKPFQKAVITYGKPLDFSEYKMNKKDKDTMENVTAKIMEEIIKLA
jgi:1-acyl-sn-glycerol-3-phosphate acyltransferase